MTPGSLIDDAHAAATLQHPHGLGQRLLAARLGGDVAR
jgi:hypothetical protein